MYDRYDTTKGRYVKYDYQPKGDKFGRSLAERPRVWTTATHYNTGHRRVRRTRTSEAQSLTIARIKELVSTEVAVDLENHTLYFLEIKNTVHISQEPLGFPVRFEATQQAKGKRHWFICLGCARRVGKLYTVKTTAGLVWGCRTCLGLSYPSQYMHKPQARDNAIIQGKIKVSFDEWCRAMERDQKRTQRLICKLEKLTGTFPQNPD